MVFEFHGWFCICESPEWLEDGRESKIVPIVDALRVLVTNFDWKLGRLNDDGSTSHIPDPNSVIQLDWVNGSCFLHLWGNKNYRRDRWQDLQRLLDWICTEASGSYGLLYLRDDEDDLRAEADDYQVMVMARGEVTRQSDPFLSPLFRS